MKYFSFSPLFAILFLSNFVKGNKSIINYYSNNLINSIKNDNSQKEYFFSKPQIGKGYFNFECEPGDKIIIYIILKNNINSTMENEETSFLITFEDNTKYLFNKDNISIYDIYDKNNISLFFYIPYETYCKNKSDIIIYNKKDIINFDLNSNIFIKNNKIQSKERLDIKITEIFPPNLIIKKNLNKTYTLFPENSSDFNFPITIKYLGVSTTGGSNSYNECRLKIVFKENLFNNNSMIRNLADENNITDLYYYNDSLYNNSKALENIKTIERFFKLGFNIFNLSSAIFNDLCIYIAEEGKDVVLEDRILLYFQNYSICNANCVISNIDINNYIYFCKCSETTVLINDNIGKIKEIDENSFSKETISEEISDIFFETNFEVLSCFFELLEEGNYKKNVGGIMTTIFLIIQALSGIYLFKQIRDIRLYLYSEVIKKPNPPKRGNISVKEELPNQIESGSNSNNNIFQINNISPKNFIKHSAIDITFKNRRKRKNENASELSSKNVLLASGRSPKVFDNMIDEKISNNFLFQNKSGKINQPIKKIYPLPKDSNDLKLKENDFPFFESEYSSQRKLSPKKNPDVYSQKSKKIPRIYKNSIVNLKKNSHYKYDENELIDYLYSQKTLPHKKIEENKRYNKPKDEKEQKEEINSNNEEKEFKIIDKKLISSNKIISRVSFKQKEYDDNKVISYNYAENVQNTDRNNKKEKENGKIRRTKTKKSDNRKKKVTFENKKNENKENKEKKENKYNNIVQMYEKKELDTDDLNQLDFDEAIIYDRRGFWELTWMEIKDRQLIINTFFVKERLKPFSIKLIVFIFSLTFYFVINGLLYDTNYVSKKLKRKSKSTYFFFVDSIKRIIYSSLVGVLVNVLVGLLFRSDKNLRKAQNKYKDNPILLNGEIVKIYKNMKITNFIFTIVNFIIMIAVWIYLFCFCGVYRNCQMDWVESALLIIGIMQVLPILISLLLALLRIIGLRCGLESCFRITSWISDNT